MEREMAIRERFENGTPSWVDVSTKDADAVGRFYRAVFGWRPVPVEPIELSMGYTMLTLRSEPVAAISPPVYRSPEPVWTTYIAVDDCDATFAIARDMGAAVAVEPMDARQQGRLAILADPQGAYFGLWQAYDHVGARIVNEPGSLCWNQLATSDVPGAVEFYGQVFGWKLVQVRLGDDVPPYNSLTLNGRPVAGATPLEDEPGAAAKKGLAARSHWIAHFAVADCDATLELVTANGGTIEREPATSLAGRGASCRDPLGAYFSIITLADALSNQYG